MSDEIETAGKVADATKEVAKTGGKAMDAASGVGRFFNEVFGDLVVDGFGLVRDRLRFYRFERAVLLAEKTQKRLEEKGITNIRPVPPKIAIPIIENATIEDEDELHTLWANLLASAMDRNEKLIKNKQIAILQSLDLHDVKIVRRFASDLKKSRQGISVASLVGSGFKPAAIQHLYSVGILTIVMFEKDILGKVFNHNVRASLAHLTKIVTVIDNMDHVVEPAPNRTSMEFAVLTELGVDFIKAAIKT